MTSSPNSRARKNKLFRSGVTAGANRSGPGLSGRERLSAGQAAT